MDKEYSLWKKYGNTMKTSEFEVMGPHSSYEWRESIRRVLFSEARYKFAAKMLGNYLVPNTNIILEMGCSDGLGACFLAEFAKEVFAVDFDEDAINFANEHKKENITFILDNFLGKKYGEFDGVVSFDVIEHIYPENVDIFIRTVVNNLKSGGVLVIGTPSYESQKYSRENVAGAHVNVYKGEDFYLMLKKYFHNVFIFTQNDEIIHTGHLRMANYLIAICTGAKI